MSTTLTNGLKLPDKGSVDWYADMQNNYTILDGAVGTIADHTTAIAGKAPSLHTHTKSDVTDLLNSNFIPSANNSYDLGSSSYQWNNLYAKNYYYNGTEFQSKFVTADTVQTVNGVKTFTAYVASIGSSTGDEYSSNTRTNLWLMGNRDTKDISGILFDTYRQNTAQGTGMHILGIGIKENSVRYEGCRWGWYWDNALNGYSFDFKPTTQGANQALKHNLGTSVDKWDTLNGINPGALSLPSGVRQSISEYITDVNLSWNNQITAVRDGYIVVTINDAAGNSIYLFNNTRQYSNGSYGNGSQGTGRLTCMLPVNEGDAIIIFIKAAALSDVFSAYLYVMNGNVNALPSS